MRLLISAIFALVACNGCGSAYKLKDQYDASNFFDKFNFRDKAYYDALNPAYNGDPTNGSVKYLSRKAAASAGLINTKGDQVYIGVDHKHVAGKRDKRTGIHARQAVRLESKVTFSGGLVIADIENMPGTSCGVWPSLWMYNMDEDPVGEIDIIEGINKQKKNVVSLHTCGKCSFSKIGGLEQRSQCNNGGTLSQQCEDGTNYDGCGNTFGAGSYGLDFNNKGGGVYAVNLDKDAIKIFWWPRNKIPADVKANKPNPHKWGTPAALFKSSSSCNVSKYFKKMSLIINTTFCGDNITPELWKDSKCRAQTGAATCDAYVAKNPGAFEDDFWKFNYIQIWG